VPAFDTRRKTNPSAGTLTQRRVPGFAFPAVRPGLRDLNVPRGRRVIFMAFALGIWQPKIVIEARFSRIVTSTGSLLCSSGSREQGLSPAGHGWSLAHGRFLYLSRLPEGHGMSNRTEDFKDNGLATLALKEVFSGEESLPADRCLEIYRIMVR